MLTVCRDVYTVILDEKQLVDLSSHKQYTETFRPFRNRFLVYIVIISIENMQLYCLVNKHASWYYHVFGNVLWYSRGCLSMHHDCTMCVFVFNRMHGVLSSYHGGHDLGSYLVRCYTSGNHHIISFLCVE